MYSKTHNNSEICVILWKEKRYGLDNVDIINAVLNFIFCVPTVAINFILLAAVWRTSVLRTPSNILICALATTDLFVGLTAQPLYGTLMLGMTKKLSQNFNTCVVEYLYGFMASLFAEMSFLTFTAISVDKLLMIHFHLRYNTLVTKKRTAISLAALLLTSGASTALYFVSRKAYVVFILVINCTCLIIAFISYIKIYRTVTRHQQEIHDQTLAVAVIDNNNKVLELARFKKRTFSMLYIYAVFLLSYSPLFCTMALEVMMKDGLRPTLLAVKTFAVTLVFCNSLVNPLLICWKMKEIRNAMKQVLCFSSYAG